VAGRGFASGSQAAIRAPTADILVGLTSGEARNDEPTRVPAIAENAAGFAIGEARAPARREHDSPGCMGYRDAIRPAGGAILPAHAGRDAFRLAGPAVVEQQATAQGAAGL